MTTTRTTGEIDLLALDLIRMDGATQPRAAMKEETIAEYEESIREGAKLPPPVIFFDGECYWLADGYHRVHALGRSGLLEIEADIRQGTRRDAILYSVGANASHGLPRTIADKRRAVETLMRDEEWCQLSNREIARRCGVTHGLTNAVRDELSGYGIQIDPVRTVERNGTTYEQNVGRAARKPSIPLAPIAPRPDPAPTADEPADIAAGRRNGTIRDEEEGEWCETEGTDAPSEPAAEQTDDEYLAECPARAKLSEEVRGWFDAEALLYRDISDSRRRHADDTRANVKRCVKAAKGHQGPLVRLHYRYLSMNDPTRWEACGDCRGTATDSLLGKCVSCKGHGYHDGSTHRA